MRPHVFEADGHQPFPPEIELNVVVMYRLREMPPFLLINGFLIYSK